MSDQQKPNFGLDEDSTRNFAAQVKAINTWYRIKHKEEYLKADEEVRTKRLKEDIEREARRVREDEKLFGERIFAEKEHLAKKLVRFSADCLARVAAGERRMKQPRSRVGSSPLFVTEHEVLEEEDEITTKRRLRKKSGKKSPIAEGGTEKAVESNRSSDQNIGVHQTNDEDEYTPPNANDGMESILQSNNSLDDNRVRQSEDEAGKTSLDEGDEAEDISHGSEILKSDNEVYQTSGEHEDEDDDEEEEAVSLRPLRTASPDYQPPCATLRTTDIRDNDTVIRYKIAPTGGAETSDEQRFVLFVLRCPKCTMNPPAQSLETRELHLFWTNHAREHEPNKIPTKDDIVKIFGIPISDGTQEWLDKREGRERSGPQTMTARGALTSFFKEKPKGKPGDKKPGDRSRGRSMTDRSTTKTERSKPSFQTSAHTRPSDHSKPSPKLPPYKNQRRQRSRGTSIRKPRPYNAPYFGPETDEDASDEPQSPIRTRRPENLQEKMDRRDREEKERVKHQKHLDLLEGAKNRTWEEDRERRR